MSETARQRGRPRRYDPDAALRRARNVFWDQGFAASSLDRLGDAMAMNRPSLYGAFGDKQALYLRTLERYRDESLVAMRRALDPERPLRECLDTVYGLALSIYLSGESGARGCFLIGTAATEAVLNPQVREVFGGSLIVFDQAFEERFRIARDRGEISRTADVTALARLASAVMHTLALRARGGESRATLEAIAKAGVQMLCAHAPAVRSD